MSQDGRRHGTPAMHELISIKCVAWEKINGVEAATRHSGKWLPLASSSRRIHTCPRTQHQSPQTCAVCSKLLIDFRAGAETFPPQPPATTRFDYRMWNLTHDDFFEFLSVSYYKTGARQYEMCLTDRQLSQKAT